MRHKFVSAKSDEGDASLVDATQWNEVHVRTVRNVSTTQVGQANDDWVKATGGAGGITYTMPGAPFSGQTVLVQKVDSAAGVVTILPGAGTINSLNLPAQSSAVLVNFGQYMELTFDGTNWWVTKAN